MYENIEVIKRRRFDNRQLLEVFSQYISDRTDLGDLIRIKVIWAAGDKRPSLLAEFNPRNPKKLGGWVDFTELLPEAPGKKDPVTGTWRGFYSWRDAFLHKQEGWATMFEGMSRRAGRSVLVVEERGI